MKKEDTAQFVGMTKKEYTWWLLGYLAGTVDYPVQQEITVIDERTLKKIPGLIDVTYKSVLALHDFLGINLDHYEIFGRLDPFETEIGLFYIEDGETVSTPFIFQLASVQKPNLN